MKLINPFLWGDSAQQSASQLCHDGGGGGRKKGSCPAFISGVCHPESLLLGDQQPIFEKSEMASISGEAYDGPVKITDL